MLCFSAPSRESPPARPQPNTLYPSISPLASSSISPPQTCGHSRYCVCQAFGASSASRCRREAHLNLSASKASSLLLSVGAPDGVPSAGARFSSASGRGLLGVSICAKGFSGSALVGELRFGSLGLRRRRFFLPAFLVVLAVS